MRPSRALTRVAAVGVAAVVIASAAASAGQQASTASGTGSGAGSGFGRGAGQTAGTGQTTSGRSAQNQRDERGRPQGFSVVLVLADLQAASGEEDVPPAARKALADMKDFLPYRSYRLLDASWILCCGNGRTTTTSRLKGPDDRDYELELASSPSDQSRTFVQFSLRDASAGDEPATPQMASTVRQRQAMVKELEAEIARLHQQMADTRARQGGNHPDVVRLQTELSATEARLTAVRSGGVGDDQAMARLAQQRPVSARGNRSVMSTSFTMDLGETVVVGTSRLSGNRKALIALLTAVPPRSTHR